MQPINPKKIRFIKLGERGEWEESCIKENTIRLGYRSPHHNDSLNEDWERVKAYWLQERNNNQRVATSDVNQIRDFYELEETDLWITFYKRTLYWCLASKEVIELEDQSRIRKVLGQWQSTDIYGKALRIENIDGRITKVQGFRGTICAVSLPEYLIKKINGQSIELVENTKQTLDKLKSEVADLIQGLWWHDFELLVDLIFSNAGWQRFSVLGKTEKDIDLDVYSPATQKRAFVQIKTATTRAEIERYIKSYDGYDQFDEMFFVFHTCDRDITDIGASKKNIQIWDLKKISSLVVNAGLVDWLINKRA